MHVGIVTHEFGSYPGGIATYYNHLAAGLVDAGHQVTVVTPGLEKSGDDFVEQVNPQLRVVHLPASAGQAFRHFQRALGGQQHETALWLGRAIAARDWLVKNAAKLKIDVLDTTDFAGPAATLTDTTLPPVRVTCHGSFGQIAAHEPGALTAGRRALIGLEWMGLTFADAVTAYSPANAKEMSGTLGREVSFVPPLWKNAEAPSAGDDSKNKTSTLSAIVIGRLQSWKGCLELLEALRIARGRGIKVNVEWIGADTETAPEARSMAGHLAGRYPELWGNAFRWTPHLERSRIAERMASADCVIIPSRWETFSFAAAEVMAAGRPLIISSGAGASYLCREGENALVIPPHDAAALANALERLALEPELRARLGSASTSTLRENLDVKKTLPLHLAAYDTARTRRAKAGAQFTPPWQTWIEPLLLQATQAKEAAAAEMPAKELARRLWHKLKRRFFA